MVRALVGNKLVHIYDTDLQDIDTRWNTGQTGRTGVFSSGTDQKSIMIDCEPIVGRNWMIDRYGKWQWRHVQK